jgi:hypothetical protein
MVDIWSRRTGCGFKKTVSGKTASGNRNRIHKLRPKMIKATAITTVPLKRQKENIELGASSSFSKPSRPKIP